ncbi:MAG: type II toxin-antitoxin system VapC family toxin, partial [Thermodesulfovibrionales bacterium]
DVALAEKYREIMLYSENFTVYEISNDILELAARIRARYEIRTPDALQIATGIFKRADIFLSNDSRLNKIEEIKVMLLEDIIKT